MSRLLERPPQSTAYAILTKLQLLMFSAFKLARALIAAPSPSLQGMGRLRGQCLSTTTCLFSQRLTCELIGWREWRSAHRPAPCTLHPAPCTLHLAPCTLHLDQIKRRRHTVILITTHPHTTTLTTTHHHSLPLTATPNHSLPLTTHRSRPLLPLLSYHSPPSPLYSSQAARSQL